MDISARSDYAVRAMLTLTVEGAGEEPSPVSVERLAVDQELPQKFLESIVGDLRRAGLVVSRRGAKGGYVLARSAAEISLGDIIRAVDGPLAEIRGARPQDTVYRGSAAHLGTVWIALRAAIRRVLDDTSLAEVASGELPAQVLGLTQDPDALTNR